MFIKKTRSRSAARRLPSRNSRLCQLSFPHKKPSVATALCAVFGIVLSALLSTLSAPPSVAQIAIPNQASIEFNTPVALPPNNGGETEDENPPTGETPGRTSTVSNPVTYPISTVLGESTLGLSLVKTADKAAAEPGDVVLYQLLIRNQSPTTAAEDLAVTDTLPLGVQFIENSAVGEPTNPTTVSTDGRTLRLSFPSLAPGGTLAVTYAAILTPDAIRGNGRNTAAVSATGFETVEDAFQLTIRQGILSDCGTIIGRVFVDKNFDGHQQDGEPGIPNAVIYMESGNRIITDPDGLFSIVNALSGNRVGALDLSSLPGYTLAPNLFRVEDNSQSRLVRLEPGGLARMNFAVTPAFGEGES